MPSTPAATSSRDAPTSTRRGEAGSCASGGVHQRTKSRYEATAKSPCVCLNVVASPKASPARSARPTLSPCEGVEQAGVDRLQNDERHPDDAQVRTEDMEERAVQEEERRPVELVEADVREHALAGAPARVDDVPLVGPVDRRVDGAGEVE